MSLNYGLRDLKRYLANLFNILLKLHLINIYNIAKFNFSFLLEKLYHLNNNNHSIFFFKFFTPFINDIIVFTLHHAVGSRFLLCASATQHHGWYIANRHRKWVQLPSFRPRGYVWNHWLCHKPKRELLCHLTHCRFEFLFKPFKKFRFCYCLLLPRKSRNKKQTILFSFSKIKLKTLLTYSSFIFFVSH